MSHLVSFIPRRVRIVAILFSCVNVVGWLPHSIAAVDPSAQRAQAFDNAVAAFRSGRSAEGEGLLLASVTNKSGSAVAHFQTASGLVRVAFVLRQSGDAELAEGAAQRALHHLQLAEQKLGAGDRVLAAPIKHMAGVIHERFAGSTDTARAFYRAAVQLDPQSPAGVALNKLEEADRSTADRQAAKINPRR